MTGRTRPDSPLLPDLDQIEAAARDVYRVCRRTPLVPSRSPSQGAGTSAGRATGAIWLKIESLQSIGSFKLRGVFYAVARMSDEQRARGLLTVSAGNTAQALAWCGRYFDVPAASLMPEGAPQTKIDAVRALGGTPRLVPTDELFAFLQHGGWEHESAAFVHPWIEPRVVTGHASLGLEIGNSLDPSKVRASDHPDDLHSAPSVDRSAAMEEPTAEIYVPVGGGGLMAGVGAALEALGLSRRVRLIAVEPSGCPALSEALRCGRPVDVDCETMCDGVAVPYLTAEMFPVLRHLVDEVVLVDEPAVRSAIRRLAFEDRLIVEGSAALAYAAALRSETPAAKICVLSGANLDREKLLSILGEDD